MAALLQLATVVAHTGLALFPWVRTLFARFPICLSFATPQVCSTVTAISVFSIGPFINLSFILICVSLWKVGLFDVLRGVIQGRNIQGQNGAVRLWQFSPFAELILFLMPCSLSYVIWLFLYVHKKWTVNFLEPIQVLHLGTSVVFALGTIIIGSYLVAVITFPTVIRNLHRNRFRPHIFTLVTLNIALVSYCASVIVLLDNKSEKWDVIAMAVAEIMHRVVCTIAVIKLRSTFEAAANAPQEQHRQEDEDAFENAVNDNFENIPPPANVGDLNPVLNLDKQPTDQMDKPFVTKRNDLSAEYQSVTRDSFVLPFWSLSP